MFYAHSTTSSDGADWEPLADHLDRVATLAGSFAAAFGSREWGELAGLWHDLGKFHPRFQQRLRDASIHQPHSGAGACVAAERDARFGRILAAVIAGHHSGLANWADGATLNERLLTAAKDEWPQTLPNVPDTLLVHSIPQTPAWLGDKFGCEFWIRMLFSALVDADRLCTEEFHDPHAVGKRTPNTADLETLTAMLEAELIRLNSSLDQEARERDVNRARGEISQACLMAAALAPGLFSLTVPTGGGKTLAAMRFALHHGLAHRKRRVIAVIPYTSIIEQNAKAYARIFGSGNVLEHHSNLDVERRKREAGEAVSDWQDRAAENWDAPIIVTTTVQFFESLFTNHPSRARKLHNIANSVVILDEVQSLPPGLLLTILDGLKRLTKDYGCSVVLSTATPPALKARPGFVYGLEGVREIVPDPSALARRLRRVRYEWPLPDAPAIEWVDLAAQVAQERAALVVTHRRSDARELAQLLAAQMDPDRVLHLSALMCPAHRLEVLGEVRRRLVANEPCLLISTQLIEAGVDVDFPVVFRALGGLDSVVQAAGRCNREGRLPQGRVVVFRAPSQPPPGIPRRGLATTLVMLGAEQSALDADDPATQERYFTRLYNTTNTDSASIQREREQFNFATVAEKFRMIEDGFSQPVAVPFGGAMKAVAELQGALARGDANLRDRFRALQPYTVSVYPADFAKAVAGGALVEICEGLHHLRHESKEHYHEKYGLIIGDDIVTMDAGSLIH